MASRGKLDDLQAALGTVPLYLNERIPEHDVYYETVENGKTFLDSVHNLVSVHPLLVAIIDTLQFQRLRDIKMLGTAYFVFPGGTHTRFEHCIGVSYLAGEFVSSLRLRQPELKITKQDVLAVMIAGLCHDLGHGPFSHTFEKFIHAVNPDSTWTHEQASIQMFRYLLSANNLRPVFEKYGMAEIDIFFIEELILGERHVARGPEKAFLYEIVANKRNGCDVDRWDYFLRDSHHTNVKCTFENHKRIIDNARAICVDGEWQICYRDKLVGNIRGLFELRCELHRKLYQNKSNKLVEQMVIDALAAADDHLHFPSDDGNKYKMSQAMQNMSAYMRLDDSIICLIRNSVEPGLKTSRDILTRIYRRDFYTFVMRTAPLSDVKVNAFDLQMELASAATMEVTRDVPVNDVSIIQTLFDYGMKDKNPFEMVAFFSKNDQDRAKPFKVAEISHMLPGQWQERSIWVYYKKKDPAIVDALRHALQRWASARRVHLKSRMDSMDEMDDDTAVDGFADTIPPDADISALRQIVFDIYRQTPSGDTTEPSPMELILKRLDEHEAGKRNANMSKVESRELKTRRSPRSKSPASPVNSQPPL